MIEFIGWVGAICFAVSAAPQAYMSYKDGHSQGIASGMLWLWIVGEVFTLYYVLATTGLSQIPLLANYVLNLLFLFVIIYYKLFRR